MKKWITKSFYNHNWGVKVENKKEEETKFIKDLQKNIMSSTTPIGTSKRGSDNDGVKMQRNNEGRVCRSISLMEKDNEAIQNSSDFLNKEEATDQHHEGSELINFSLNGTSLTISEDLRVILWEIEMVKLKKKLLFIMS